MASAWGIAAPFVMNRHTDSKHPLLSSSTMSDEELLFESLLRSQSSDWSTCDGCPPPLFNLPPPPRPPFLDDLEGCDETPDAAAILAHLDTCDNTVMVGSHNVFEDAFHSVAVIVVCAVVLVIVLMLIGIVIFRRRKSLYYQSGQCLGDGASELPPSSVLSSGDFASSTVMRHEADASYQMQQGLLKAAQKRTATLDVHFPRSSLPNHYIGEPDKHRATLAHGEGMRQAGNNAPRGGRVFRLAERSPQNAVELSTRPHLYHNFPHIIIGGQPFYLIPSEPAESSLFDRVESADPYAYPQNVPIYEEIDKCAADDFNANCSCDHCSASASTSSASDRGEAGSDKYRQMDMELTERAPRVLVNPLMREVNSDNSCDSGSGYDCKPRMLGSGLSPALSASSGSRRGTPKAPLKSLVSAATTSSSSAASSIYYYSDTLRKRGDDLSDSGFSGRSGGKTATSKKFVPAAASSSSSSSSSSAFSESKPSAVDLRVVLVHDGSVSHGQAGADL